MVPAKGTGLHPRAPVANLWQRLSKNWGGVRLATQSSPKFLAESGSLALVRAGDDSRPMGDVGGATGLARTLDFLRSLCFVCRSHRRVFRAYGLSSVSGCLLDRIRSRESGGIAERVFA